jgi:hypothetical protein
MCENADRDFRIMRLDIETTERELKCTLDMINCFNEQLARCVEKNQCIMSIFSMGNNPCSMSTFSMGNNPCSTPPADIAQIISSADLQCHRCTTNNAIWKYIAGKNSSDYKAVTQTQERLDGCEKAVRQEMDAEELAHGPIRAALHELRRKNDDPLCDDEAVKELRRELADISERAVNASIAAERSRRACDARREEVQKAREIHGIKERELKQLTERLHKKEAEISKMRRPSVPRKKSGKCIDILCKNRTRDFGLRQQDRDAEREAIQRDVKFMENELLTLTAACFKWKMMVETVNADK